MLFRSHAVRSALLLLLLLLLLLAAVAPRRAAANSLSPRDVLLALEDMELEGAVDVAACYSAIAQSDIDGSNEIEFDEYVAFLRLVADDETFLAGVEQLTDLPFTQSLGLASNFNLLACLCEDNVTTGCCKANEVLGIAIDGSRPGETPTESQEDYLYLTCHLTKDAVDKYLASFPPTERPTVTTQAPSVAPSASPSDSPSAAPTQLPSASPTATPSASPTATPSSVPSVSPTVVPVTPSPTSSPTSGPTATPSVSPSVSPSNGPTLSPTSTPTSSPSQNPTSVPSSSPTHNPTLSPTVSQAPTFTGQTRAPTDTPSVSPTAAPSASPSASPTLTPSSTPTLDPTEQELTLAPSSAAVTTVDTVVEYQIGIEGGASGDISEADYNQDLVSSLDQLSSEVLESLDFTRRLLRHAALNRRLQSVQLPTQVPEYSDTPCPDTLGNSFLCRNASATVVLTFQSGEVADTDQAREDFETAIQSSIDDGDLQEALDRVNPASDVIILNGVDFGTAAGERDGGDDSGIGGGGIAGIAIGAVLLFLVAGLLFARRSQEDEKPDYDDLDPAPQNLSLDEDEDGEQSATSTPTKQNIQHLSKTPPTVLGAAASPDYGKIVTKVPDDRDIKGITRMREPSEDHDSSSNAGSSGWSSSAGISSLNTGSADGLGLEDDPIVGVAGGTSLAAIGAASYQRGALDSESSDPSHASVTREDLDSAIEAGDWAAVGATAAILAAASDSQSYSSRSGALSGTASQSQSGTSFSSLDAARAAELDHLVDAGDWEGVVLAAAKFESAEGSTSNASQSRSIASGSERSSESGTADGESATYRSASVAGSMGSTPSKALRRQELRAQVEELVRRVVPEEINNVDEMMLQFRGREEELVETLRTMQERAVAQKARQSSQKAAKAEAKRKVQASRAVPGMSAAIAPSSQARSMPSVPEVSEVQGRGFDSPSDDSGRSSKRSKNESDESPTPSDSFSNVKARSLGTGMVSQRSGTTRSDEADQKQSALEKAIEAGDWEAVSEVAAMMSEGGSMTSADSEEINRLAAGVMSDASSAGTSRGDNSDRAAELDELIDKGDWTGVVAAASRYTASDAASGRITEQEIEERRARRMKRLQEEEEALKQAEIWMAIAEQSKQDSEQEATGASDAADWAIARSLNLLVEQEQQGALHGGSSVDSQSDSQEV